MIRLAAIAAAALAVAAPVGAGRSAPVAYVGCSLSTQSVHGYGVGAYDFWRPAATFDGRGTLGVYPGGDVALWARAITNDMSGRLPYWREFDAMNAARPGATRVWFQVCVARGGTVEQSVKAAEAVLAEVGRRLPGAVFYASPVPDYAARPDRLDVDAAVAVTRDLVARGLVQAGPVMPRLAPSMLLSDRTHMNKRGEQAAGLALLRFFGARMVGR